MGKAPCCDKANVKKGPWSPEEDSKLKKYIAKHGTGGNWITLPQKMGLKRCGKSCRLRWLNYLRPNIKHGGFSLEEDNIICSLYTSIGSRWSIIAAQLPGRTDNDIKNYWNTRLKKELVRKSKHHQTLLASAKQESHDFQTYGTSEYNTSPNLCGPQQQAVALDYHMHNNYMNGTYSDFGHGIICQLFEENCGSTITGSCSSSEPAAFQMNRQQAIDWEVSERNSCLTKLPLGFGASPVDNCLKHCTISPVHVSGCMNASQMLQSFAHNQDNSDATSQIFYEPSASPVLMDAIHTENHTKLENPSATFAQNDISLLFSASSLHEEENCESAWTNTFSAESINWASSGISAELNDSLVYEYMSPGQERENSNYVCASIDMLEHQI